MEADNGYRGCEMAVRTPSCPDVVIDRAKQKIQAKVRARHETVNERFKNWGVLKDCFRHSFERHGLVFRAVAVITQLSLENGEPLFNVAYNRDSV